MLGTGLPFTEASTLSRISWGLAARHRLDGVAPFAILSPASGRSMLGGRAVADSALISRQGGVKYVIGKDGRLQQVAANALAYDSSSGHRQLKFEGVATNFIRNSTMQGAAAGSPGTIPTNWSVSASGTAGLTQAIVGVGTANGMAYIDIRWFGTATTADSVGMFPESGTQITAVVGQAWTHSAYIALVGGAWPTVGQSQLGISERSSANGGLIASAVNLTSVGATPTRVSCTRTLTNGSVAAVLPTILYTPVIGAVIDFTIRIAAPQMEMSPAATSCIPTSGAAVTRPTDVAPLWSGADQATTWAWRGNVPSVITYQSILSPASGSLFTGDNSNPQRVGLYGHTDLSGTRPAPAIIPGTIGVCGGWGTSGRRIAAAGAVSEIETNINRPLSGLSIGRATNLDAGQILNLDELVAWRLPDRPSAAGCQGQAKAWSV